MSKLQQFEDQLVQVEREINEKMEHRDDLLLRISEERAVAETKILILNKEDLHKLICLLDHSIISIESVEGKQARMNLIDFKDELTWSIADIFSYNLNEGTIDPKTNEFYTYKSRR